MADGSTIEQLNYEVILQDSSFKKDINELLGIAEKFNTNMTQALNLKKAYDSAPLKDIHGKTEKIVSSTEKLDRAQKNYSSSVRETNSILNGTTGIMRTLAQLTGVAFGVEGVRRFMSSLVSVTGEFEVQKMALTSMLQDADKAEEIFTELRQNALNSPYTFQDLSKYAKQLTAFNIDADQLVETENRLADVAAGLGVDMGRIILAYGQVKAAGVLKGTELRQFTEAGVPLLQSLAEQITETEGKAISLSEVFQRISKKEIPFEMVEEAFRRMTSEGGKFYNMQEVLVNTLQGKIGKLRDVWQQALYDIGTANDGWLKGGVDLLTVFVANLDKVGFAIKPLIVGFGAYAAALALVAIRQKALQLAQLVSVLFRVVTGANSAASAIRLLGVSTKAAAGALGLLVAAGFAIVSALSRISSPLDKFKRDLDDIHTAAQDTSSYDVEIGRLNSLRKTLNDSTSSYEQRKRALDEIKAIVPGYHAQLSEEGRLINNNKEILDQYIESMNREAKMAGAKQELAELYNKRREVTRELRTAWESTNRGESFTIMSGGGMDYVHHDMPNDADYRRLHTVSAQLAEIDRRINDINRDVSAGGGFLLPDNNTTPTWTPLGGSGKDDELNKLKASITLLEGYRDAYDKLEPFFGEETGSKLASIFGGDAEYYNSLDVEIVKLSNDLRNLGDENGANSILKRIGIDPVSKIVDAQQALAAWRTELEKLTDSSDKGPAVKLQEILSTFRELEETIDNDEPLIAAFGKDPDKFFEALEKMQQLRKDAHGENEKSLRDSLISFVNDFFTEQTSILGLENLADKSIAGLKAAGAAIDQLNLPPEVSEIIKDPDLLKILVEELERLKQEAQGLVDGALGKATEKKTKDILERIKEIGKEAAGLFSSAAELASASGKDGLAAVLSGISDTFSIVGSAFDSFAKENFLEGGLKLATGFITKILQAEAETAKLKQAIKDAAEAGRAAGLTNMLGNGVSSIFGDNQLRQISNAANVLGEAQKSMAANAKNFSGNLKLKNSFWSFNKWKPQSLATLAESIGRDLYDSYGNLNAETLQEILKTYTNLGTAEKGWIQQAINDSEAYTEAMEKLDGVMGSIVGGIVSDAASQIVDQWAKAGDAALDYADILDDVTRAYAKMITESLLLDTIFDEDFKNQMRSLFKEGDYDGVMDMVLGGLQRIQETAPQIAEVLEPLRPYLKPGSSDSSDTLKSGISKELVEGNSTLIASYLNAMRADVSVMRTLQSAGWQNVSIIREYVPTYAEHLAGIEANTFNIAQTTQTMLARVQSVITQSTSGGSAIRTTK